MAADKPSIDLQLVRNIGVIAQLHFYIDDLFPNTLGTPIFGGKR